MRLVEFATRFCPRLPGNFPRAVDEILAALPGGGRQIIDKTSELLDGLDSLMREEKLLRE
jgi:hypothetical protein